MIRDTQRRFLVIPVLVLTLCHRTSCGGSWRRLERMFLQDHQGSDQWDENRIIFPDTVERAKSSWRSTTTTTSTTTSTTTTTTTPRYNDGDCESKCHISREYSPLCGTNGLTYQNLGQLQCAMGCGVAVDFRHHFPCSSNVPTTTSPVFTTTSPFTSNTMPTRRNVDLDECIRTCPSTPEYNPVCGSNQVTYNNVGKMRCARLCGVEVNLLRQAPCPTPVPSTTSTTAASTTRQNRHRQLTENCMWNCPATPQYNPVCGSNDVTYYNIGKLQCAKQCGVDVRVQYQGRCESLPNRQQFDSSEYSGSSEEDYDEEYIDPRFYLRNVQHWK